MEERYNKIDEMMFETNKKIDEMVIDETKKDELYDAKIEYITGMLKECIKLNVMKHNAKTPIKSLLINKRDIYIVNDIHGTIMSNNKSTKENPYTHFIVPDGLFFFYLKKVPFGVCNFLTDTIVNQILMLLSTFITYAYIMSDNFKRKNAQRIQYVLLEMQKELYRINKTPLTGYIHNEETNTSIDTETSETFKIYKKYSHIKPEISIYKNGNKIINKMFSVLVKLEKGKLIFTSQVYIVTDDKTYNLLDYINPKYIEYKNNKQWTLMYLLEDIIKFLRSKKIHNCIYIDLSCSDSKLSNNVNSLITTAHEVEGETYNYFNKIKQSNTKRNKNRQYAPKSKSRSRRFW